MQFLFPALAFGFFLVMAPVLIHLINMMRHRRVKWAAMDFLLASYKKHKKWIWLKQLLLLLMRMAAIAAVVAMLAQLITRDEWAEILSGRATHHYVVIDDSYSMADRVGGVESFARALQAVARIAERAVEQDSRQKITLLRFSRASRAADEGAGGVVDHNAATIDGDLSELLGDVRSRMKVTQLASGPVPALDMVRQLLADAPDENALVYIISDFRKKEWDKPEEARKLLEGIEAEGAAIHLVRCAQTQNANLAITQLEPAAGVPAAGVPLFGFVTVANYGERTVRGVVVKLRTVTYSETQIGDPRAVTGVTDELSAVLITEIQPGQKVTERFQVTFPTQGYHVLEAELDADAVDTDNRRWCVVDFSDGLPVLLVDGSVDRENAYFLLRSLAPSLGDSGSPLQAGRPRGHTGIIPEIRPTNYLRDTSPAALGRYHAIYLLDVGRLDASAVRNLQQYVEEGGGLAMFLGEHVDPRTYDEMYADGEGLFPALLDRPEAVRPEPGERESDFTVENHPITAFFHGERNLNLRRIFIYSYWKTDSTWEPPADSSIRVLAHMRGTRDPLIVEKHYGAGRVVAFLTSLSPQWNNWTGDPTFVATMLSVQDYLSAGRQAFSERQVGTPIEVELPEADYDSELLFTLPTDLSGQKRVVAVQATRPDEDATVIAGSIGLESLDEQEIRETDYSGVYSAWPLKIDGQYEALRFALNVDASEGDMTLLDDGELSERLDTVEIELHDAESLQYELAGDAGYNWSQVILFGLLGLLIGEQALAFACSYHPARGGTP